MPTPASAAAIPTVAVSGAPCASCFALRYMTGRHRAGKQRDRHCAGNDPSLSGSGRTDRPELAPRLREIRETTSHTRPAPGIEAASRRTYSVRKGRRRSLRIDFRLPRPAPVACSHAETGCRRSDFGSDAERVSPHRGNQPRAPVARPRLQVPRRSRCRDRPGHRRNGFTQDSARGADDEHRCGAEVVAATPKIRPKIETVPSSMPNTR